MLKWNQVRVWASEGVQKIDDEPPPKEEKVGELPLLTTEMMNSGV